MAMPSVLPTLHDAGVALLHTLHQRLGNALQGKQNVKLVTSNGIPLISWMN